MKMPTLQEDCDEIKRLTETLVRILNGRDFSYQDSDGIELLAHISSDFEARFDTEPNAVDFEGQTEIWEQAAVDYPFLHFDVLELTPQIRRRSGTASVYLKLAITGMSDKQFQGACQLEWKYRGGQWLLYRHVTMRGVLPEGLAW